MIDQLVRPPTLTAAVTNNIRKAILRGDLKQGKPLREVQLGKSLDVARGTVREALRALQEDGLVEIFPRRGAFVTTLSSRKVREIYTLRELLEPYAVGLAMENDAYGERDLEEIDALLRKLGELERRGQRFEQIKADVEFHYLICKPSDHQLLLNALKNLQSLVTLCVTNLNFYELDPAPQEQQHRAIFDAIRSSDPAHAQDLVIRHLRDARDLLLAAVTTAEADSP
jgi:DNA-binding GntR family transcriptional regulator